MGKVPESLAVEKSKSQISTLIDKTANTHKPIITATHSKLLVKVVHLGENEKNENPLKVTLTYIAKCFSQMLQTSDQAIENMLNFILHQSEFFLLPKKFFL